MTIEEKLKDLILSRYKSLREFTIMSDIPHSTVVSILKRGVANSSVSNIIKICKILNLSVDALADGKLVYKEYVDTDHQKNVDIKNIVGDVKSKVEHAQTITIDGKPIDIEQVEPILNALDIGYEMAKKKTKKALTES